MFRRRGSIQRRPILEVQVVHTQPLTCWRAIGSADSTRPLLGRQVTLDASNSSDTDGTLVSYLWSVADTDIGSGETLNTTFNVGAHEVVLTVTDNFGSTATDSLTVFVA
ncbi:MAG: PKD domain-containing protein, partial [Actinobacteria bacterium]|nr:PKD domain-containing protein [Actinomycetota bacterium]